MTVNDRVLAANTDETFASLESDLQQVFGPRAEFTRTGSERELFRVQVRFA